jgi:pimeloyl-ACP methyl ester carboxylesterase
MLSANLDALRRPEQESVIKTRRTRWVDVSAFIVGLVCSVFALTLAPSAIAQTTTYIYTGAPFTGCAFGGCSPGATHITGSFTVAKPLPNNLVSVPCSDPSLPARCLVQIFPISFSFTDGNTTFTEKNAFVDPAAGQPQFEFTTDGQGQILQWTIDLEVNPSGVLNTGEEIDSFGECFTGPAACGSSEDDSIPNFLGNKASFNFVPGTWKRGAFDLLDPVPSFGHASLLNDQGIINDVYLAAASTQIVNGVAADGTTQVVVRFDNKGGNSGDRVEFSLFNDQGVPAVSNAPTEDGYLTLLDGTNSGNTITVPALMLSNYPDPMAFAIYHAPIDFVRPNNQNDPAAQNRAVTIQVQVQSQNAGTGSVRIVRPPVALIHGLWSDLSTWDFFSPLALPNRQYDSRFQAYRIDYKEHNGDHVDTIVSSPGGPIDQLLSDLADFKVSLNVAAIQFDVVVHSMGGLVTRDMTLDPRFLAVANFKKGLVHKLITIGTPHNGSPLVNELNQSSPLCKALFGRAGQKVAGAVQDLSVGSSFLTKVNGSQQPSSLKAHAIVGIASTSQQATSESGLGLITTFVCKNVLPSGYFVLYGGDASDLLVPETSQHFNFFPATTFETVSDTIHSVAPLFFPLGPDELNRVLGVTGSLLLNPLPASDPAIDPNRVINGLNTPISDTSYFADIKP